MKKIKGILLLLFVIVLITSCGSQENKEIYQKDNNQKEVKEEIVESIQKPKQEKNKEIVINNNVSEDNFFKFKSNEVIEFDTDKNGEKERIEFDVENEVLKVNEFNPIKLDTTFMETEYFIIFKADFEYFIGLINEGLSEDYKTEIFKILKTHNNGQWFAKIDEIPGKMVDFKNYQNDNAEHFNYFAFVDKKGNVNTPIRLKNILPQTWWGRTKLEYREDNYYFADSSEIYNGEYETNLDLRLDNDIIVYLERDLESETKKIKSNQYVKVEYTDNNNWIAIKIENDDSLYWVNLKETSHQNFYGFTVWD
jgi:hypothetical protein